MNNLHEYLCVAGISAWKVSIVREGDDGRLYGYLLAYNQDYMIYICDKLIEMNYAFSADIEGNLISSAGYLKMVCYIAKLP